VARFFGSLCVALGFVFTVVGCASGLFPIAICLLSDQPLPVFLFCILSGHASCLCTTHLWTSESKLWKKLLSTLLLQLPIVGPVVYFMSLAVDDPLVPS
jgi:hypothetical protein